MTSGPYLRLVPKPPAPRPRRLDVRLHVLDGRYPYARTRAFRLTHDQLDRLVEIVIRMEARS
jgi:hypothetical protein